MLGRDDELRPARGRRSTPRWRAHGVRGGHRRRRASARAGCAAELATWRGPRAPGCSSAAAPRTTARRRCGRGARCSSGSAPTAARQSEADGRRRRVPRLGAGRPGRCARRPPRRPVVVVLDDLHWADTATLRVLRLLAETSEADRLLRRHDLARPAPAGRGAGRRRRDPGPAPRRPARARRRRRARRWPGSWTRSPRRRPTGADADALRERTDGNPFFLIEYARLAASRTELQRPAHRGPPADRRPGGARPAARSGCRSRPSRVLRDRGGDRPRVRPAHAGRRQRRRRGRPARPASSRRRRPGWCARTASTGSSSPTRWCATRSTPGSAPPAGPASTPRSPGRSAACPGARPRRPGTGSPPAPATPGRRGSAAVRGRRDRPPRARAPGGRGALPCRRSRRMERGPREHAPRSGTTCSWSWSRRTAGRRCGPS